MEGVEVGGEFGVEADVGGVHATAAKTCRHLPPFAKEPRRMGHPMFRMDAV